MSTPRHKLYLYDNGPSLWRVLQRPLVRCLLAQHIDLAIGVCAGDEWVFADLTGPHCRLVRGPLPASHLGAITDLRRLCPPGHIAIDTDSQVFADTRAPDWRAQAMALARRLVANGLHDIAPPDPEVAPLFDLPAAALPWTPQRPTVYLDLDRCADAQVQFVFDLPRLLAVLPEHDFACTATPPFPHARLLDASAFAPQERATLSTRCEILVGCSWLPWVLTLHEANRHKPQAVCGYDTYSYAALWDAGSSLEHLPDMDALAGFLAAHRRQGRARALALGA